MAEQAGGQPLAPLAGYFTEEAQAQTAGSLKQLVSGVWNQPVIGLHGGLPPAACCPFKGLEVTASDGQCVPLDPAQLSAVQLQYSLPPTGYPPLREWAEAHVREVHRPPAACSVILTDGNSHALAMLIAMFMRRGDTILVEEYTYPHILECVILPKGGVPLPVPMDGRGILPDRLRQLLEERAATGAPMPRLLYTVPAGQNPTGAVTPLERKRAIYEICREFDVIILEDDPYFFLQYPGGTEEVPGVAGLAAGGSYLSLDVDGRVVRLDSFSKFFSPGLRLGWAAGQPAVIDKLATMLQGHSIGASGITQLLTQQLLAAWGSEGLERHVQSVQREYARRAAIMHEAAQRELAGLAEWERPEAGMFLWIKLLGVEEAAVILPQLMAGGVVVVPGRIAHPRVYDKSFKCPWVRLAFSYVSDEDLQQGVQRLGTVLRQLAAGQGCGGEASGRVAV